MSTQFKNVHCVPRPLVDGRTNTHYYHRPTRTRLPPPDSPEFQPAYAAAEQQWAAQQPAANPSGTPPEVLPEPPHNQCPAAAEPSQPVASSTPELVTRNGLNRRPSSPRGTVLKAVRRRAAATQAEVARVIRAAKQAGAAEVEVRLPQQSTIVIRLQPSAAPDIPLAPSEEIVL